MIPVEKIRESVISRKSNEKAVPMLLNSFTLILSIYDWLFCQHILLPDVYTIIFCYVSSKILISILDNIIY